MVRPHSPTHSPRSRLLADSCVFSQKAKSLPLAPFIALTLDEKVLIFGGRSEVINQVRENNFVPLESSSLSNKLFRYDPLSNNFSCVETTGAPPTPRIDCGAAPIDSLVFIYGGHDGNNVRADLYELNMDTRQWTEVITEGRVPRPRRPRIQPLGFNHILHITDDGEISLLDVAHKWWTLKITNTRCESNMGLTRLSARMPTDNGFVVFFFDHYGSLHALDFKY